MENLISKRENGTRRVQVKLSDESQVEQSHAGAVNINTIVKKYHDTGHLPDLEKEGVFGDFSNSPDFHAAQNMVIEAKSKFQELPARIRERFANDPGRLLDFVGDPANLEEGIELGLMQAPALAEPEGPVPPEPAEASPKEPERAVREPPKQKD